MEGPIEVISALRGWFGHTCSACWVRESFALKPALLLARRGTGFRRLGVRPSDGPPRRSVRPVSTRRALDPWRAWCQPTRRTDPGGEPPSSPPGSDGPLDVRAVVLLGAAAGTVYVAYRSPAFGMALTVGVAVLLALHLLMKRC